MRRHGGGGVRGWWSVCMDAVRPHMLKFRDELGMSRMRLVQLAYARRGSKDINMDKKAVRMSDHRQVPEIVQS